MGNCLGTNSAMKRDRMIDRGQRRDAKNMERKFLLLGPGESGKSTLFKQMKIIYQEDDDEDLSEYKNIIQGNMLKSMVTMLEVLYKTQQSGGVPGIDEAIQLDNEENEERAARVLKVAQEDPTYALNIARHFTPELVQDLDTLWKDSGVQKVFDNRARFQLLESTKYFYDNMDRIREPSYTPTKQDILHCRVKTTGVVESEFNIDGFKFKLVDVGGQRNERKKWIHCFDNVTAVIFVVAISEYDQLCYEDHETNRITEALNLFEEMCNSKFFENIPMVVLLNKNDLFKEKINKVDLSTVFDEYDGGADYKNATMFMQNLFEQRVRIDGKKVSYHFTSAIDQKSVLDVFQKLREDISL